MATWRVKNISAIPLYRKWFPLTDRVARWRLRAAEWGREGAGAPQRYAEKGQGIIGANKYSNGVKLSLKYEYFSGKGSRFLLCFSANVCRPCRRRSAAVPFFNHLSAHDVTRWASPKCINTQSGESCLHSWTSVKHATPLVSHRSVKHMVDVINDEWCHNEPFSLEMTHA